MQTGLKLAFARHQKKNYPNLFGEIFLVTFFKFIIKKFDNTRAVDCWKSILYANSISTHSRVVNLLLWKVKWTSREREQK